MLAKVHQPDVPDAPSRPVVQCSGNDATFQGRNMKITWTAPYDNRRSITKYVVQVSTSSSDLPETASWTNFTYTALLQVNYEVPASDVLYRYCLLF